VPTGRVKWYDAKKGWGFIQADDGSPDVFVHHAVLEAQGMSRLEEGQAVTFEMQVNRKGPRVVAIQPA
jgi:CspA family cold shock protein